MKNVFTGKVGTWFVLSVLITVTIAFGLYGAIDRSTEARRKIEHTHEIIRSLRRLHDLLNEAIISGRMYILRSEESHLRAYHQAIQTIGTEIKTLQGRRTVTAAQRKQIAAVESLLTERLSILDTAVERKRTKAAIPPLPAGRNSQGEQITRQIRQILADMQAEQSRFSAKHSQSAAVSSRRTVTVFLAGTVTNLVILAVVFYLFAREIEQRRLMDESLRQSEERFRGAFDAAAVGMAIAAPNGRFLQVNRSFCEILGYTEEELLDTDLQSITHPDDLEADLDQLARILDGKAQAYQYEKRFIHKAGHSVWIHVSASLVRDSKGQPVHFVGLIEDITLRKASEEAMARAKEAAEAAVETKAAFLANMSHEIRTPMNGVLGVAELLLETSLDHVQRDYAATIRNSADALLTIINDILDLSKIEAGKMVIEHVAFDLRTLMEEVADLLAPRAHQRGLQINCRIPANFPERLFGDPVRVRQILTNLVGNAVKFTEVGEVSLEAQFCGQVEESTILRILIRDTGIGIPCEQQDAIFEGFTQADGGTDRRYGGTGLGLTICRQLARLIGGQIGMESEVGRGSTFWLELAVSQPVATSLPQDFGQRGLDGLRILIVDENATNRSILCEHLQSWGCCADEAESLTEALHYLRPNRNETLHSLILVDESLVELTCNRFAQFVQTLPHFTTIPLILVRSLGRNNPDPDTRSPWFESTLTKPVRRSQLMNLLLDAIASRQGTNGCRRASEERAPQQERLNLRILVADDHAVNRKVALRMLEQLGCLADAVDNGREAVEMLDRTPYDVVLMDVQMPVLDGLEATRRIRRRELETDRRRVPVLALTAHAMEGDKRRCLAAGMDGYVPKPVKRQELLAALSCYAPSRMVGLNSPMEEHPQAVTEAKTTVFCWETLLQNCDGDEGMVREVVESFLSTAPRSIENLESALAQGDPKHIANEAHGLRGSCLTLRAPALAEICREIEQQGVQEYLTDTAKTVTQLRAEWTRLRSTLENLQRVGV